ncbi:MAG TPA: hypothetical protein VFP65_19405 [Anaeromyxobacteraceae bacterium]|nr:hypothetical protein [Anaeromyxobacteraceae bacterium]
MTSAPLRIAWLLEPHPTSPDRPWVSEVTAGVLAAVEAGGARVDAVVAEHGAWPVTSGAPPLDLAVLKSESAPALALAAAWAAGGLDVVNAPAAVALARDKVVATAVLAAAGVPVPASFTAGDPARLAPLLGAGPLWVKRPDGTKGAGVRRVTSPDELAAVERGGVLLAQREVPSHGLDVKVYGVGDLLWATERPFPARTEADKRGRPAPLAPAHAAAARRAALALGLAIFGVDLLVSDGSCAVVDVNAYPGFKGVEAAPAAIAELVLARARAARATRGEPSRG